MGNYWLDRDKEDNAKCGIVFFPNWRYKNPSTQIIHDASMFQGRYPPGIMRRYGKKMLKDGAKYYGRLRLN